MNDKFAKVIDDMQQLIASVHDDGAACSLASRYCPEPWAKSLGEIASTFMFTEIRMQEIALQIEAIFNEGSNDFTQDLERP